PARGDARLRARARLRRLIAVAPVRAKTAPGIVVRVRRLSRGPVGFGDVPEVDADPGPRAGSAAHRIDQDVVRLQLRRGLRVARLPPLEPRARVRLVPRLRDRDEGLRRAAA